MGKRRERLRPEVAQRKKWYGTQRWKKLRKRVLIGNPMCSVCHRAPATAVDHITHRKDNATFWDLGNLRPICQPCNSTRSAREMNGKRRQRAYHAPGAGACRNPRWGSATTHGEHGI